MPNEINSKNNTNHESYIKDFISCRSCTASLHVLQRASLGPIEYDDQKTIRDNAIIARLIEIRKAQIEYKNMYKTACRKFRRFGEILE